MKIGVTCYPTLGGSGVVATELGKIMAQRGHEVHFIAYDIPFRLNALGKNIKFHRVTASKYDVFKYPPYDLALSNCMYQVAKTYQLDILHVHYAIPHSIAAVLAKAMTNDKLKVVTTLHGTDITVLGEDPSLHDIICYGLNNSDKVTAVSDSLVNQTKSLFNINKEITRVYNFVDDNVYYPKVLVSEKKKLAPNNERILLHISNFRPVKRPVDTIRILNEVIKHVPAKLILLGDGPCLNETLSEANKLGLKDKVLSLGKQDDASSIIPLADVILVPSEKESFGLAALEAMACGVPVVGSDSGGLPEVVEHNVTGFLSEVGNIKEMAFNIVKLLQDEKISYTLSENSLNKVKRCFLASNIADQYENLYLSCLK